MPARRLRPLALARDAGGQGWRWSDRGRIPICVGVVSSGVTVAWPPLEPHGLRSLRSVRLRRPALRRARLPRAPSSRVRRSSSAPTKSIAGPRCRRTGRIQRPGQRSLRPWSGPRSCRRCRRGSAT